MTTISGMTKDDWDDYGLLGLQGMTRDHWDYLG